MSLVLLFAGCAPKPELPEAVRSEIFATETANTPVTESPEVETQDALPTTTPFPTNDTPWINTASLPWQTGYVQYRKGKRVGYSLLQITGSALQDKGQIRVTRTDVMDYAGDGSQTQRTIQFEAIEKSNGELRSFTYSTLTDGVPQQTIQAQLLFDRLQIATTSADGSTKKSFQPWQTGTWSAMGIQAMLMRSPMHTGDRRSAQFYVPQLQEIAVVELVAGEPEATPLSTGLTPILLPIDVTIGNPESGVLSRIWINDLGEIEKTLTRSGDSILTLRVPIETVQRFSDADRFAKLYETKIPVQGDEDLLQGKTIALRIETDSVDPYSHYLQTRTQAVRSLTPRTAQVTLLDEPSTISEAPPAAAPSESELEATVWLPSKHRLISDLAGQMLAAELGEDSAFGIAQRLSQGVASSVALVDTDGDLRNALQVARSRQGNSTEKAMLLAALLRNQSIPSRLMAGLQFEKGTQVQLGFSIWCQAFLDGDWVDLIPETDASPFPRRIAMKASAFTDENPYGQILIALESLNQVREVFLEQPEQIEGKSSAN